MDTSDQNFCHQSENTINVKFLIPWADPRSKVMSSLFGRWRGGRMKEKQTFIFRLWVFSEISDVYISYYLISLNFNNWSIDQLCHILFIIISFVSIFSRLGCVHLWVSRSLYSEAAFVPEMPLPEWHKAKNTSWSAAWDSSPLSQTNIHLKLSLEMKVI